jgi:PAS domain S-box-containing protein/putative nucleotidyltransferase with HDIG domain
MKKLLITPFNPKALALLVVLVLLGCLGNYFVLPLFFGADFIFGSIAVFIVFNFYGLGWGLLAALIINSLTYSLWGHPYSFITFMLEALFVGYFLHLKRRNIVLLDGLFWLVAGMPLAYVFMALVLQLGPLNGLFIMLKQSVNGVFNALIANLAINYLPWGKFLGTGPSHRTTSLRLTLSNLLVAVILVPALIIMLLNSRDEVKNIENDTIHEMRSVGGYIVNDLSFWYRQNLQTLTILADLVGKTPLAPSPALESATETIDKASANFRSIYVGDAQGTSLAFSPAVDGQGRSLSGRNYADRPYFKEMQSTKRPVLSAVYIGRAISSPTVSLSVPILQGQRFSGYVSGAMDLSHLQSVMKSLFDKQRHLDITLVDSQGNVITSTKPSLNPLMPWKRQGGAEYPVRASVHRWFSGDKTQPSLAQWRNSVYVGEYTISDLPWKVVVEASMAPLQQRLYLIYIRNLATMAGLSVLVLLLAALCGRWVVRPLSGLVQVTSNLPEELSAQQDIAWPASSATEINDLVVNFQAMARTLKQYFQDLQEANAGMTAEIAEGVRVEAALRDSEARYRLLADNARDVIWMLDLNLHFTYISPSVQLLTGFSVDEWMARGMQQMLTPASFQVALDKIGRIQEIERLERPDPPPAATLELEFFHQEGGTIWVEVHGSLLRDSEGHHIGFMGVTRDITERKRVEEALAKNNLELQETAQRLEQSRNMLQLIIESVPVRVFWKDHDLRYLGCNTLFARDAGLSHPQQLLGKDDFAMGWREQADFYRADDRQVMESLRPKLNIIEPQTTPTGAKIWLSTSKVPLQMPNGEVFGVLGVYEDITDRKLAEEALQNSEERLRLKLDSILTPDIEIVNQDLSNILDTPAVQSLMEDFTRLTSMGMAIIDLKGNVLVATGWQDICTEFHRVHPQTARACIESDLYLAQNLQPGEYVAYKCRNHLWDVVTPLFIGGKHVGNIYTGQFFYKDEDVDDELFNEQAAKYGFDQEAYLSALHQVPRVSRDRVNTLMDFLAKFSGLVSKLSYSNLKLAKAMSEQKLIEASLRQSEERFRLVFEKAPIGIMHYDQTSTVIECNEKFAEIIGAPKEKFIGFNMIRQLQDEQMRKAVAASLDGQVGYYEGNYLSVTGGKLTSVRAIYQPIFSSEGAISGGITIYEDITERLRAVSELKLKERLLDSASDSIFLYDLEGNFLYMNEAAYITRWYAKEELLSLGAWALDTPEAAIYQDNILRELWANGEMIFESEHRRKDGSVMPVEIFARVVAVEGRELILSMARDITERHKAEEALKESLARVTEIQDGTIQALVTATETRDPYTAGHQRRVTQLACAVARELGLSAERVAGLRVTGLLHDIGKISVPAEILSRPGKISQTEMMIVRAHAESSYDILKKIAFPWPVAEICWQHHERLDGSGYPRGLAGEDILLEARILAVADVVEAMVSHRPYRPALGMDKALEEIERQKGTLYDPQVVEACTKLCTEARFSFD